MLKRLLTVVGLGAVLSGCQDLQVVNHNEPDRERALSQAADVETLIVSTFGLWWGVVQGDDHDSNGVGGYPSVALTGMADQITGTTTSWGLNDMVRLDDDGTRFEFNNLGTYTYQWVTRNPWYKQYQVISNAIDGLEAIERHKLKLGKDTVLNGPDTKRAQVFAHYMIALAHIYLGYHHDQAYIYDYGMTLPQSAKEFVEKNGFRPYQEIAKYGREKMKDVISMLEASPFDVPFEWMRVNGMTNTEMIKLAHSYIARSLVYTARDPAERASVDWGEVLYHLDRGIDKDFGPGYKLRELTSTSKYWTQLLTDARAAYGLIGPADTSGGYQAWLNTPPLERVRFDIETPDRRVTGATPKTDGKYFTYRSPAAGAAARPYLHSSYSSKKYGGSAATRVEGFPMVTMSVAEMKFLRAEAYYHTNKRDLTAEIINETRVPIGELPPVTVAGVPDGTGCVPRRNDGGCGDLLDALIYEKRIETVGTEGYMAFSDWRGWGKLVRGTPIHFPVPSRELETLYLPYYTLGGAGKPGGAP